MNKFEIFKLLSSMALRSVENHRAKTLIVGSIMFFGAMLWTMGSSLLASLDASMSKTIVGSVAGDMQIYAKDTRDQMELFGGATFGAPDIGEIGQFEVLESALGDVANIDALVPMGTTVGMLGNDSELDRALGDLRRAVYAEDVETMAHESERVRYLIGNLKAEIERRALEGALPEGVQRGLANMSYALAATFWSDFAADRLGKLEFLDTRVAPLGAEGTLLYMRLLGTDLEQYPQVFQQFYLVEGQMVPPGERGIVMSSYFYEKEIKNRVAREFDRIKKGLSDGKTLATDVELKEKRDRMVRQYRRVLGQLDPREIVALEAALRAELPDQQGNLEELLQALLNVDDANFARRYDFFYREIAPRIRMYPVLIGETVTIRAFARSGYMRAANLKLYGIFNYRGMEQSDLAGVYNLIDMDSFRDMIGAQSAEQRAELADLDLAVGAAELSRDDAEAALFGDGSVVIEEESGEVDLAALMAEREAGNPAGDPRKGLALHAAIKLKDARQAVETQAAVQAALDQAQLNYRVIDWRTAAGWVGQMTMAMNMVLVFGMAIIFLVALVVMNNTVLISTMERIGEIGTLRAIGAQRNFVLWMFLIETTVIASIAALLGAAAGAGLMTWLGAVGIPAFADEANFLFGGPRLYPSVEPASLVTAVIVTVSIAIVATFFPARHAAKIQPVEAMHGRE